MVDFNLLNNYLRFESWGDVFSASDASSAFDIFLKILHSHVSFCTNTVRKPNKKLKIIQPWINYILCRKIKFKHKLKKKWSKNPNNNRAKIRFLKYSKKLREQTSIAKTNFYVNKFNSARGNSKKEWNIVNDLLNRNPSRTSLNCLKVNNEVISDKIKMADLFNSKFTDT
jgi:hypothetical protein